MTFTASVQTGPPTKMGMPCPPCPYPGCGAGEGEPCTGTFTLGTSTVLHLVRVALWHDRKQAEEGS